MIWFGIYVVPSLRTDVYFHNRPKSIGLEFILLIYLGLESIAHREQDVKDTHRDCLDMNRMMIQ